MTAIERTALACTAVVLLLAAGGARAGVTVKLVSAGRNMSLEFEGDKVRIEEEGSPRVVVFDGDQGRYLEIDNAARTWSKATRDDVVAAGRAADAKLRQRLSSADPEAVQAWIERRNRIRKRIQAMKQTRFEPSGAQAMLADHTCDGFDEVVGGEVVAWGCYVPWSKKTVQKGEFDAITRLAEFLNSGLGHVQAAEGIDLRDGPLGRLARSPGFPLFRLEVRDGGKSAVPMKVVELTHGQVSAERFAPPAGYTAMPTPASLALPLKASLPAEAGEKQGPGASEPLRR